MSEAKLDHAVIYIGRRMEEAHAMFSALGFFLTPRGYQSLGSINHLAMFGTDYLEIVGLPSDGTGSRPDLDHAPVGINGLVFKSDNAQETYAHLQSIDRDGAEPVAASRPVDLDGETKTASFRNINVRDGAFDGGRVYFCEHRTTELVWRPEYLTHHNGVVAIRRFVIVSDDPARVADEYAALLNGTAAQDRNGYTVRMTGFELSILSAAAYRTIYGDLASSTADRSTIFGAIEFQTSDLSRVRACLDALNPQPPVHISDTEIAVRLPDFDAVLTFSV